LLKVLLTGSTGFAGKNIAECLSPKLGLIKASRSSGKKGAGEIYFDLFDKDSWQNILSVSPDVIINAAAYGVVKLETDTDIMYKTNYYAVTELFDFLQQNNCKPYWLQLGTAFEYDLSVSDIREDTPCLPRTHYGISKLLCTNYLLAKAEAGTCSFMRPFGMFGKYEDDSKFFPSLINAQKTKSVINLSAGTQKRDYIYVEDLGHFINSLLVENSYRNLPPVLNLGCGKALSFREYADVLRRVIPACNDQLWNWGQVGFRPGESPLFYSASPKAARFGFVSSSLEESFRKTSEYYLSLQ
jgi:nucleoside-diphosphate-sugar epimerase